MLNLGELNKTRARRPYWLLLALVLFFAGQIATAAHWHNDINTVDAECALCMLSSATGAAIIDSPLALASVAFCTFIFIEITRSISRQRAHAYDSRAPPLHS